MTDNPKPLHPALEAYRTSPADTEATLRNRANRAAAAALRKINRDANAPDVQVREIGPGGRLTTAGDKVARVNQHGRVVAKPVSR